MDRLPFSVLPLGFILGLIHTDLVYECVHPAQDAHEYYRVYFHQVPSLCQALVPLSGVLLLSDSARRLFKFGVRNKVEVLSALLLVFSLACFSLFCDPAKLALIALDPALPSNQSAMKDLVAQIATWHQILAVVLTTSTLLQWFNNCRSSHLKND